MNHNRMSLSIRVWTKLAGFHLLKHKRHFCWSMARNCNTTYKLLSKVKQPQPAGPNICGSCLHMLLPPKGRKSCNFSTCSNTGRNSGQHKQLPTSEEKFIIVITRQTSETSGTSFSQILSTS